MRRPDRHSQHSPSFPTLQGSSLGFRLAAMAVPREMMVSKKAAFIVYKYVLQVYAVRIEVVVQVDLLAIVLS